MYFDYRLEQGPRYLTQYGGRDGLPSALENMDAAFIWEKNYKAYFFKGWEYWRYDEISKGVDPGYPKNISIWGKCLVVFVTIEGSPTNNGPPMRNVVQLCLAAKNILLLRILNHAFLILAIALA